MTLKRTCQNEKKAGYVFWGKNYWAESSDVLFISHSGVSRTIKVLSAWRVRRRSGWGRELDDGSILSSKSEKNRELLSHLYFWIKDLFFKFLIVFSENYNFFNKPVETSL